MKKRFTDCDIWEDEWFMSLSPLYKEFWRFICDRCDASGVWKTNFKMAGMFIGEQISDKMALELYNQGKERIRVLSNGNWFLPGFISFQYGKLSADCKPHKAVFSLLEKHGIDYKNIEMSTSKGKNAAPQYIKDMVFERDGLVCFYTGKQLSPDNAVVDHIIPRSKGGTDDISNLVVCSSEINTIKSDLSISDFCVRSGLNYNHIIRKVNERLGKGLPKPYERVQDKEKDKDISSSIMSFNEVWKAYPVGRRGEKAEALKAWNEHTPPNWASKAIPELIMSESWTKEDGKYIPGLAKWIRSEGWDNILYTHDIVACSDCGQEGIVKKGVVKGGMKIKCRSCAAKEQQEIQVECVEQETSDCGEL